MSTSYVPEFCTTENITDGVVALLKEIGVQAAEELAIKEITVRDGRVTIEILPSNMTGSPIAVGIDVPTIWAEVRARTD